MTAGYLIAARAMTEAELQQHVRDLCAGLGLYHYHPHSSRHSEPGWPDSVVVGARVLFRELKTERGSLTPEQRDVGDRLTGAGQDWAVWRPRDLYSGAIARQLADASSHQLKLWDDAVCAVCRNPLNPALAARGDTKHPGCDAP